MPAGRPPSWPKPWLDLAAKAGGSAQLRATLGYRSKTTLSDKINGRSPWTRSDYLLLSVTAERFKVPLESLLQPFVISILSDPDGRPVLADAPVPE